MKLESLKRMVRALNSVLNLYDVDDIPDWIVNMLMEGINKIVYLLKLGPFAKTDSEGTVLKYIVPDDFEKWYDSIESILNNMPT